jgi:hypothetical protein
MALGMARFRLISAKEDHVYTYQQLQGFITGEHLKTAWSGKVNPDSLLVVNLLNRLLTESDQSEETRVLKIHLSNPKINESFTIKYHYDNVAGEWLLKRYYCHRNLFGLFSFRLDDDTWLRTRFSSRKMDIEAKNVDSFRLEG